MKHENAGKPWIRQSFFRQCFKITISPNFFNAKVLFYTVYVFIYVCIIEVQLYMIWMYRHIAAFVSRYSDILYDTVKCELAEFYR